MHQLALFDNPQAIKGLGFNSLLFTGKLKEQIPKENYNQLKGSYCINAGNIFHQGRFLILGALLILFLAMGPGMKTTQGASLRDTTMQDTLPEEAPNVYLDCYFCDREHIKRELSYVNYVRDRKDADVHIMITREYAANRGRRYSVFMLGQNGYTHLQDTLRFNVESRATDQQSRYKMIHALKTAITPYLMKTSLWENLSIDYTKPTGKSFIKDNWNSWIFELSADAERDGQESTNDLELGGEIEANKVTEDIKLDFEFDVDYDKTIYKVNSKTITSLHRTYDFDGLAVWSISPHWSAGGFGGFYSSKYRNIQISYRAAPALEFNIYPYMEATTRQLTFLYRPEFEYNIYQDSTIFNKLSESLYKETFSLDYEVKKKWGSIDLSLDLSHYFHDFSKNRVRFRTRVSMNVVKGFSIYVRGGASIIHDQLSLVKGDATTEEILTRQQQLATNYQYYSNFGISYTFGSMYNNVVNSRF